MSMGDDVEEEDARNSSLTAKPDVLAWRGRFTIPNLYIDINLKASKSTKACSVVLDVAALMPHHLSLEMLPLVDVLPDYLNSFPATGFTIDLFFAPDKRDSDVLDSLLTDVDSTNSALKAVIRGGFELLIFTSLQLPEKLHRLDGKVYFWGLFMTQSASSSSSKSNSDVVIQNNEGTLASSKSNSDDVIQNNEGTLASSKSNSDVAILNNEETLDSRNFEVETSQAYSPDEQIAFKSTDEVKRTGRQLDGGWAHAEPLDFMKQKTQCKYCGFKSDRGGISRMKAHLAGVRPDLPVCDKVSPQVRKSMADWYNTWIKNTKALWITEYQGKSNDIMRKRGRPYDGAWAHALPLDLQKFTTQCVYCGFISELGGISRLKVHLSGQSPRVPACLKVPQELKEDMADWFHTWARTTKATWMMESQGNSEKSVQASMIQLEEVWEHVILQLDESGQHIKCKHCNFVPQHGGIDSMIVHLSGGDPEMQLKGCPYVPPEFKSLMLTAGMELQAGADPGISEQPVHASKRQLEEFDAWEHVIRLDGNGQHIKCKHCKFVPKHGGIDCMIVHLAGGDPAMQLKGCPNVSAKVRSLISEQLIRSNKKTKHTNMVTAGMELLQSEREKWQS